MAACECIPTSYDCDLDDRKNHNCSMRISMMLDHLVNADFYGEDDGKTEEETWKCMTEYEFDYDREGSGMDPEDTTKVVELCRAYKEDEAWPLQVEQNMFYRNERDTFTKIKSKYLNLRRNSNDPRIENIIRHLVKIETLLTDLADPMD